MKIFQISQARTRAIVWVGGAESAEGALEAMAREAGFRRFADIPPDDLGETSILELSI